VVIKNSRVSRKFADRKEKKPIQPMPYQSALAIKESPSYRQLNTTYLGQSFQTTNGRSLGWFSFSGHQAFGGHDPDA